MLNAAPTTRLWLTAGPSDRDYRTSAQPWTWEKLNRVHGWEPGARYADDHGPGLWMVRTAYAAAPHATIRTRPWRTFTRHAFLVQGSRVALLTCHGGCRHSDGRLLNAITHHCPDQPSDSPVGHYEYGTRLLPANSERRITQAVNWSSVS